MTEDDYGQFCEIVLGFAELKGRPLSKPGLRLYWRAMQHWSIEDFTAAADRLLMTCDYMPEPKDFEKLRRAGRPLAGEAWARVLEFARRDWRPSGAHLRNPRVEFDQSTLNAVDAIGGFRAIAMSESSSTPFLANRFADNYDSIQVVQDTREALPQIASSSPRISRDGPSSAESVLARLGNKAQLSKP